MTSCVTLDVDERRRHVEKTAALIVLSCHSKNSLTSDGRLTTNAD